MTPEPQAGESLAGNETVADHAPLAANSTTAARASHRPADVCRALMIAVSIFLMLYP